MALSMTTNTGDSEPERSTTKTPCRNAYITAYTTAEIAQTFRRRVPPRRTRVFGTRNALMRFIAPLVLGGTNSGVKYSRKKAYRTMIEASIQISGASVTNQSSTTSVRISRRTSPKSADKRANNKIESSSQMIRDRIPVRKESRGKEVSEQRDKSIIPTARWAACGGSQARTTAPDLRSGLAGVHGFKSLARTARSGKSHPPHLACARGKPLRKTFIRGEWLAAAEEGKLRAFLQTILLGAVAVAVLAATLAPRLSGAKYSGRPFGARPTP